MEELSIFCVSYVMILTNIQLEAFFKSIWRKRITRYKNEWIMHPTRDIHNRLNRFSNFESKPNLSIASQISSIRLRRARQSQQITVDRDLLRSDAATMPHVEDIIQLFRSLSILHPVETKDSLEYLISLFNNISTQEGDRIVKIILKCDPLSILFPILTSEYPTLQVYFYSFFHFSYPPLCISIFLSGLFLFYVCCKLLLYVTDLLVDYSKDLIGSNLLNAGVLPIIIQLLYSPEGPVFKAVCVLHTWQTICLF